MEKLTVKAKLRKPDLLQSWRSSAAVACGVRQSTCEAAKDWKVLMCSLFIHSISAKVHIITGYKGFFCFCVCFQLLYIASVHFCDTEKGGKL